MFGFLLAGIVIIAITAYMWYLELLPYIEYLKKSKIESSFDSKGIRFFKAPFRALKNALMIFVKGKYFLIDMGVTLMAVSILSFGNGPTGGLLGLLFSDAVSILILAIQRKMKKEIVNNI